MFRVTSTDMQSTATSMFSAYASFAAFMMMFRSLANDLVPEPVRTYLHSFLRYLFGPLSSTTTIVIEDEWGISRNDVYDSVDTYLRTKISPTTQRFKVGKSPKQKTINLCFEKNQEINDTFSSDGLDIHLKWRFISIEPKEDNSDEKTFFELSFNKKFKEKVMEEYLPYIMAKAREIEESDKVVKLFSGEGGGWGSINLDHPSSFDTLAMEPKMKKAIIDDLDRFVKRKNYYKKVGKAWKRGYLLYGPPGTGKSSLVAAMANYLKFDVYDLQLNSMQSNSILRRILLSTTNRSIILIEDIDCSVEMQNRSQAVAPTPKSSDSKHPSQLTLSGVLNFIDGLWSSCGDERIIIFTTNHKDKLDPALLRPGRMDLHIHMSYCTYQGFRLLASNYLGVEEDDDHELFGEIKELMEKVQVTPAELAEELMKSEDVDIALAGVIEFLKCKKIQGLNKDDGTSLKEERLSKDEEPSLKDQVLKC